MRSALVLTAVAALGLAACEEGNARRDRVAGGGRDGICKAFGRAPAATPGPMGMAAGPEASFAVDDCLHRWGYTLARSNDDAESVAQAVNVEMQKPTFLYQQDAPSCHDCGSIMVRNGSCYKCLNCGSTSGCS